jgi:hypothetical protein
VKKPTNIRLGAIDWEVFFGEIPGYICEALDVEPEDLMGATDEIQLRIYMRDDLKPNRERITFLHEIVHALCGSFHLGFNDSENEEMVDAIAKSFYNFMKQNPKAVEWLMKEE